VILFADSSRTIRRMSAAGGVPSQVLSLDKSRKENSQIIPQLLPDGRRFLYESFAQQNGIVLGSLDGKSRLLMPSSVFAGRGSVGNHLGENVLGYYAPSGKGKAQLLFLRGNQLVAQPFDPGTAAVSGEPVPIAEPLQTGPTFSASENGVLIFRRGLVAQARLTWFDRKGKPVGTAGDPGIILSPRISPDQKSVAFYQGDGMSLDISLFDGERGNITRFTSNPDRAYFPAWSPDGSRIAYFVRRSNQTLVIERPASGMEKETVLYRANGNFLFPQSWSRNWLLLADAAASFYLLPMGPQGSGGERQPIPFPESPAEGRHPSFSPDGRWLLYSSTKTGRREVFAESMPEEMGGPAAGARMPVSIAGGAQPAWRADGKMMSVSVDSGGASLKLSLPEPLFPTRLQFDLGPFRQYDVSADGKRFLLAQPLEESTSVPITVIVNWPALLKKGAGAP
jgi:Tol biopolymer transport system component